MSASVFIELSTYFPSHVWQINNLDMSVGVVPLDLYSLHFSLICMELTVYSVLLLVTTRK